MKRLTFSSRVAVILMALVFILISCARNPVTGKKELMLMSVSQEKALGASYDPQVVSQFGVYQDDKLQAFISEKGKKMAAISHRPGLDYKFRVVDSPVVNAFAVPGGYVYFTRGIMAHFNNEAEFIYTSQGEIQPNKQVRPKRMSVVNNCLDPCLWEINASDAVGEMYHAWLDMPDFDSVEEHFSKLPSPVEGRHSKVAAQCSGLDHSFGQTIVFLYFFE